MSIAIHHRSAGIAAQKQKPRIVSNPDLSIIFPVYNEHMRLLSGLSEAIRFFKKQSYSWEILLIDDGSELPVQEALKQIQHKHSAFRGIDRLPIRIYRLPRNMGKGAAITLGVRYAKGKQILFSDIDLSVPLTHIAQAKTLLASHDIVIASRRLPNSTIVVHQPWLRETGGRIFTSLSNMVCRVDVHDATCGFKLFHRDVARHIFSLAKLHRWVFDTEILFLARRLDYSVGELPVAWTNKQGSKVRSYDSIKSFADLFTIRWNEYRGGYDRQKK